MIEELLELAMVKKASDLHISANMPPMIRVDGKLVRTEYEPLSPDEVETLLLPMLNNEQRRTLEQTWELDFSYGLHGLGRFRVNIYKDRGNYAAAFRTITSVIPAFEDLGLPQVVKDVAESPRGLVLVTGPTGSGKSTTLASMVDYINKTRGEHIITIEDPIEYIHTSQKCMVHQRELGQDTHSFANALRSALREDPDVILVGELRDLDTISLALTAAETGHLVMGTLHTSSAAQTIDRIIDVYPQGQQAQIRIQLSNSLVGVFAQTLLPKLAEDGKTKKGRILAQEIMVVNSAIANLIREGKTTQIYSIIQTGMQSGMKTLEQSLKELVQRRQIALDDALKKTSRPEELKRLLGS